LAPPVYTVLLLGDTLEGELTAQARNDTGDRWIVRDIDLFAGGGTESSGGVVTLSAPNGVVYALLLFAVPSHDNEAFQWQGRQVVEPGGTIAVSIQSGTWYAAISGYQLTLP
jgi:hypothetical protein